MLVRVLFIHGYDARTDEATASHEEATSYRRLYSFFIHKTAKVADLKESLVKKEFGFDVDQQKLYFKYRELPNGQPIAEIDKFDIEEDILILVTVNAPRTPVSVILREPLDDIKVADVRLINSRDAKELIAKSDPSVNFLMDRFDVDMDKLPWPQYRDWTAEAAYLSNIIVRDKTALLAEEQQFQLQQGMTKHLH